MKEKPPTEIEVLRSYLISQDKLPFIPLRKLHQQGMKNSDYEILVRSLASCHHISLEEAEKRVEQDYKKGPYGNQTTTAFIKCLLEGVDIRDLIEKVENGRNKR